MNAPQQALTAMASSGLSPAMQPPALLGANQNTLGVFASRENFELAQRMANALATSELVPTAYKGNVSNCLVALDISARNGASPLMVMQNLHIIQGRPSWSSAFIVAAMNSSGRFSPIRYELRDLGEKEVTFEIWEGRKNTPERRKVRKTVTIHDFSCRAWAVDKAGEKLFGPTVSIEMAVREGWYTKPDSKWVTMPELMLHYRAAAFFGRLYAPELLMGLQTQEEAEDLIEQADGSFAPARPQRIVRGFTQNEDAQARPQMGAPVEQPEDIDPETGEVHEANAAPAQAEAAQETAKPVEPEPQTLAAIAADQDEDPWAIPPFLDRRKQKQADPAAATATAPTVATQIAEGNAAGDPNAPWPFHPVRGPVKSYPGYQGFHNTLMTAIGSYSGEGLKKLMADNAEMIDRLDGVAPEMCSQIINAAMNKGWVQE